MHRNIHSNQKPTQALCLGTNKLTVNQLVAGSSLAAGAN